MYSIVLWGTYTYWRGRGRGRGGILGYKIWVFHTIYLQSWLRFCSMRDYWLFELSLLIWFINAIIPEEGGWEGRGDYRYVYLLGVFLLIVDFSSIYPISLIRLSLWVRYNSCLWKIIILIILKVPCDHSIFVHKEEQINGFPNVGSRSELGETTVV